jgi:glycosyltransferase involved in cell wall biosynthesis
VTGEGLVGTLMTRQADGVNGSSPNRRRQERPRVSVVIPALNEEPNLPFVLPRIGQWVDEVILVDGHSQDATCAVARDLLPGVRLVKQSGYGKGAALRTGFAAAEGDIIVMLDADGSTDPCEIPLFLGALAAGAEFVKGTRFAQGAGSADMSLIRRFGNRLLVYAVRLLFGGRCSDLCYGYMAFWKRVLPRLNLDVDGFEIETQMNINALNQGLRIAEVPSFESRRIHGQSNLRTMRDGWRVLKTILREWRKLARQRRKQYPAEELAEYDPNLGSVNGYL